jgi:hypothetical protein
VVVSVVEESLKKNGNADEHRRVERGALVLPYLWPM